MPSRYAWWMVPRLPWHTSRALAAGALRPLGDPDVPKLDEDDDGRQD